MTPSTRTPTTANAPSSQIAGMRLTMSAPKPITVVSTEIDSGSHTRANACWTTAWRSVLCSACS